MMKQIISILLFLICMPQYIFPFDLCENTNNIEDTAGLPKTICYKIGIVTVIIAESDSLCHVYISDGKGNNNSIICDKAPILQWAFNEIANELENAQYTIDNSYDPFPYQLSIIENGIEYFVESNQKRIINNNEFKKKLDKLREYIIKIWAHEIIIKNAQAPR